MDTKFLKAPGLIKDAARGLVQAVFSVFNTVDSDGDVVLPSFFKDGQEVPISAWGHQWNDLPVGKGVVRVRSEGAVVDGRFFMDTAHGRDHFNTVKAMADLQEWSFGFDVEDSEYGDFEGQRVRFLRRGKLFEVSPVLVAANRATHTLAVKASTEPPGKFSWLRVDADRMGTVNKHAWGAMIGLARFFDTPPVLIEWVKRGPLPYLVPPSLQDSVLWTDADASGFVLGRHKGSLFINAESSLFALKAGWDPYWQYAVDVVGHEMGHVLASRGRISDSEGLCEKLAVATRNAYVTAWSRGHLDHWLDYLQADDPCWGVLAGAPDRWRWG